VYRKKKSTGKSFCHCRESSRTVLNSYFFVLVPQTTPNKTETLTHTKKNTQTSQNRVELQRVSVFSTRKDTMMFFGVLTMYKHKFRGVCKQEEEYSMNIKRELEDGNMGIVAPGSVEQFFPVYVPPPVRNLSCFCLKNNHHDKNQEKSILFPLIPQRRLQWAATNSSG